VSAHVPVVFKSVVPSLTDRPWSAGSDHARVQETRRRSERGESKKAARNLKLVQFLSYPHGNADAVTLTLGDVERLDDGQFLNDSLIDFWCRFIEERMARYGLAHRSRLHIFSSFFFAKLVQQGISQDDRLADALKWTQTQKVDIFSKDYVFIPICEKLHWTLAVVCFPGAQPTELRGTVQQVPCILHLNSIRKTGQRLGGVLRKYLQCEWDVRHKASKGARDFESRGSMPLYYPRCPQQENEWDCGIFVLEFLERMCAPGENPGYNKPEPTLEVGCVHHEGVD
jgi:sentrin-specific protease 7